MEVLANWAYGFKLNHEGAGVGVIYYSKKYFDRKEIVNPANAKAYSDEELDKIKKGAIEGASGYINTVPENAIVGMNVLNSDKIFWYNEENSNKILASTNPLILSSENGDMKDTDGNIVARAM